MSTLHLGWFEGSGFGVSSWGHVWAGDVGRTWMKPDFHVDLARALERACFDYLLIEDSLFVPDDYGGSSEIYLANALRVPKNDPMPLVPLLTQATTHLGVVPTLSTSFYPPYLAARLLATLHAMSGGRVGCNLVTSTSERAAQNFGLDQHIDHDARYAMADEFVDLLHQLWSSWEPDAVVLDHETRVFADFRRVHPVRFEGRFFRSRGPLNTVPPSERPVIAQAGSSPAGRDFAARRADTIMAAAATVDEMTAFGKDMRARLEAAGRRAQDCKILFLATPTLADTTSEAAEAKRRSQQRAAHRVDLALAGLASLTNIDFATFDVDAPLADLETKGQQGTLAQFLGRGGTLREMVAKHRMSYDDFVGTPADVAAAMIEVAKEVGADGFLISPRGSNRRYLSEVTDGLVPELQRRGAVRSAYAHATLRANLFEF